MIPEGVPQTVSVTPCRAYRRESVYGTFEFHNLGPSLFFASPLVDLAGGQRAFVATPEKALLDLVHLTVGDGTMAHVPDLERRTGCRPEEGVEKRPIV